MRADVTAILLSYKRKPNMERIVAAYRNQTVKVDVWLINNDGFESFGADRLIAIPWNAGEMARYVFCARPETEFVCFQDDDFLIGDDRFIEDALWVLEGRINFLVGTAGRNINWEGDIPVAGHYGPEAKKGKGAAILKGHFQIFHKSYAGRVRIPGHKNASDIYWSMDVSYGAPAHLVSAELAGRLKRLDQHGVGLEYRNNHWSERSDVVRAIIDELRIAPYWWNDGRREGAYGLYPEEYGFEDETPG